MSNDADESDLFGHAISLDDGSLLVGAPGKHLEVPEIQLVVSTGSSAEVSNTRKHNLQSEEYPDSKLGLTVAAIDAVDAAVGAAPRESEFILSTPHPPPSTLYPLPPTCSYSSDSDSDSVRVATVLST